MQTILRASRWGVTRRSTNFTPQIFYKCDSRELLICVLESTSTPYNTSTSPHTLYGPDQSCSRPFCKLKRKNHYHCNACNQASSELDRLVAHIAKHSTGAILSQQQHDISVDRNDFLSQLSQKHDFTSQNFQRHIQQSLQITQAQQQNQQQQPAKEMETRVKREPIEETTTNNNATIEGTGNGQSVPTPIPQNIQQSPVQPSFEFDLGHGFHFPTSDVVAAMNQQIALMNQTLPPFLQHGGIYTGAPGLMFAPGLPPTNFLSPTRDDNPLASLAANLNLNKRPLPPPDSNSTEAKKQRLHHSMRMLKDEPVPDGYVRYVRKRL